MTMHQSLHCDRTYHLFTGALYLLLSAGCASSSDPTESVSSVSASTLEQFDTLATSNGLEPLRTKHLKKSQAEIRIWYGGHFTTGVILQFEGSNGRMVYVNDKSRIAGQSTVTTDKHPRLACDWPSLLSRLDSLDVFDLPDQAGIPRKPRELTRIMLDGMTVTFEVAQRGRYRTYSWSNPNHESEYPELEPYRQQLLKIFQVVETEFDVGRQLTPKYFPAPVELKQVVLARWGYTITAFRFTEWFVRRMDSAGTGRLGLEYRSYHLNDDRSGLRDLPIDRGTQSLEWQNSSGPLTPELTLDFEGVTVRVWPKFDGRMQLLYPNPRTLAFHPVDVAPLAVTDKYSFDEVDVLDPKWNFQTAFNEYTPPCDTEQ